MGNDFDWSPESKEQTERVMQEWRETLDAARRSRGNKSGGDDFISGSGCLVILAALGLLLCGVYIVPKVFGLPQLKSAYKGEIHQTDSNKDAVFTLTSLQQNQTFIFSTGGNIAAQAAFSPELVPNGQMSGNIRGDKTMDFTIGIYRFTANLVNNVNSLSGTFDKEIFDSNHKVVNGIQVGTWQLTAATNGASINPPTRDGPTWYAAGVEEPAGDLLAPPPAYHRGFLIFAITKRIFYLPSYWSSTLREK